MDVVVDLSSPGLFACDDALLRVPSVPRERNNASLGCDGGRGFSLSRLSPRTRVVQLLHPAERRKGLVVGQAIISFQHNPQYLPYTGVIVDG
jgi:hypothetical protein